MGHSRDSQWRQVALDCIEKCLYCCNICWRTYQRCIQRESGQRESLCTLPLLDCAEICRTASAFLRRRSAFWEEACTLCANVCEQCAWECGQVPSDQRIRDCAKSCEECAAACRELLATAQIPLVNAFE